MNPLLVNHAYVCLTPEAAVFLDLRRDQYFGIGSTDRDILSAMLDGRPNLPAASALCEQLIQKNLMTRDPNKGKALRLLTLRHASQPLSDELTDGKYYDRPQISAHLVFALTSAVISTRIALRFGIEKAVHRFRRIAARCPQNTPLDLERARYLIRAFRYLRPLYFTAFEKCLISSLTLAEFLAKSGVPAHWVFGVKTAPFEAHCWVQFDDYVFNDNPKTIRTFTPILVL